MPPRMFVYAVAAYPSPFLVCCSVRVLLRSIFTELHLRVFVFCLLPRLGGAFYLLWSLSLYCWINRP